MIRLFRQIEEFKYRLRRGQAALHRLGNAGDTLDRCEQQHHRGQKGHEIAGGESPALGSQRGEIQNGRQRASYHQLGQAGIGRGGRALLDRVAPNRGRRLVETPALARLAAINLDHALTIDAFAQHLGQQGHVLLILARQIAQALAHHPHAQGHHRQHQQADQGQLPIYIQQPGQQADRGDAILTVTVITLKPASVT